MEINCKDSAITTTVNCTAIDQDIINTDAS